MVRDRPHVVIDVGITVEGSTSHFEQEPMKHALHVVGWRWIVALPHHHRDETCFTLGDPTMVVFVETLGQRRRLAQFAR